LLVLRERESEILLEREIKVLLQRSANIERARGVAQLSLDRTHKGRRIDEGFASRADDAIGRPQGIFQWNARNHIESDGAIRAAEFVGVRDKREEWLPALQAHRRGGSPSSDDPIHEFRRVPQELAPLTERQVVKDQ